MQHVQRKFVILLVLAIGLVMCIASAVSAADPWKTANHPARATFSGGNRVAVHTTRDGRGGGNSGTAFSSGNWIAVHTTPHANATVEVHNNFYSPASVTINVGDTVTWTRVEGVHNVRADDNSFRLGESNGDPGSSWITVSHTFTQTGTFKYHCDFHGVNMAGTVIVQASDNPITGLAATSNGPTLLGNATNFTATITGGTNVSYTWNFGDSKSGAGVTTSHTYMASGIYTATVTAQNSLGSQTASTVVQVTNQIVNVADFAFSPSSVTVNVGDTVTWVRKQGSHNVDADDHSFRLGEPSTNDPGSSWTVVSHTFTQAGTVTYHCDQHSFMTGTVIVQGNSSSNKTLYLPILLK